MILRSRACKIMHLWVRKDQKTTRAHPVQDRKCHIIRRQQSLICGDIVIAQAEKRCRDVLRTNDGNPDALLTVFDGKGLRKAHCRMFACRVSSVSDLVQQTGSRGDVDKIPRPARNHSRQEDPGRIDMRHHMNRPVSHPHRIRCRRRVVRLRIKYSGIRNEDIYRTKMFLRLGHKVSQVAFNGHIRRKTDTPDIVTDLFQRFGLQITQTYTCPGIDKPMREGSSNPTGTSCNHHRLAREFHLSDHELRERFIIGDIPVTEPGVV